MKQDVYKENVAKAAVGLLNLEVPFGIGSGSTVNYFIDHLAEHKDDIKGVVPASLSSKERLLSHGIPILESNEVGTLDQYFDGADEVDHNLYCIKGRGAAMTQERIIRAQSRQFICMIDASKYVSVLGQSAALPVEVLKQARSYVSRMLVSMGGAPVYRENVQTEQDGEILDVHHLSLRDPIETEARLNGIPGVIGHGLFATYKPDVVLVSGEDGIRTIG